MPDISADDGVRIAYHVFDPAIEDDRPPVVLQHGFAADTTVNWVRTGVVRALTASGRRVIGIDARGHGASEAPHDPARYGETRMAADLQQVIDALGVGSYDLVGYSMGAIVSLLVATRDARVRRLVVGGVGESIVRLGGADREVLPAESLAAGLLAASARDVPAAVRPFRGLVHSTGNDPEALAAHIRSMHTTGFELASITAPTLILDGREDRLARDPQQLADAIPDARVRLLAGDHMAAIVDPAFAPAIVAFLNREP